MSNGKFVSYLRVSTQRQGHSGLGLEAQRESINQYLNGGSWKLIAEMVEVESGKRSDNRPKLAEALSLCRIHNATLLVARLDRLARNVRFISTLMESGVKFQAVDMPDVNEMVIHILASVAQGEAKAISERTKAALAAAQARGVKLGGTRWDVASVAKKGNEASIMKRMMDAAKRAADLLPVIHAIQSGGTTTLRQIADELNRREIPTPRGKSWTPMQVSRVLKRT